MAPRIDNTDSARKIRNRDPLHSFIFAILILLFFILSDAIHVNSQIETSSTDELDIEEIEDEIELSPGSTFMSFEPEDPLPYKCYVLKDLGSVPTCFYYVNVVPYRQTVKVKLIDAQNGEVIKVKQGKKFKARESWKRKVDRYDFMVTEDWTNRPVNQCSVYRFRLKIGKQIYFSEPFRIKFER